jgi:hypothetical protein
MKQTDTQTLKLLANFLGESPPNSSLKSWHDLKEEINKFLQACNLETDYSDKLQLRTILEKAVRQAQVFLIFPQLVGCHITCHLGLSTAQRQRLLNGDRQVGQLTKLNDNVPAIYCGELALNHFGLFNHLGYADDSGNIIESFQQIKNHLDPAAVFSSVAMKLKGLSSTRVIIDIPRGTKKDNPFLKAFLDVTNEVVVHKKGYITKESLDYLQRTGSRAAICTLSAPGADNFNFYRLRTDSFDPNFAVKAKAQFAFDLEIKRALQQVQAWSYNEKRYQEEQLKYIRNDLVKNGSDAELSTLLKNIRYIANSNIERLNKNQQLILEGKNSLLAFANEVHSILENVHFRNHGNTNLDTDIVQWDNWCTAEDYFLALVNMRALKELPPLADLMSKSGYPYIPILRAYISELKDELIDTSSIFSLVNKEDKALLHRSAIHFTPSDSVQAEAIAKQHAKNIVAITGKEWYFRGLATKEESDFRRSLQEGYVLAGTKLYDLAKNKSGAQRAKTIKFLARNLVPEANFELGSKGKGSYSKTQLRIAGALDYVPAILKLVTMEEDETALMLLHYLDTKDQLDSRLLYHFGRLLHKNERFNQAINILERSHEPRAISLLARMYHYGDGVAQDLEKAKGLYEASLLKMHNQVVKANLDKVKSMIEKRARSSEQRSYSSSSRTTSSYTEDNSFCFLTTATCKVKGYEDDCDVLTTFRQYRDTVLYIEEGGKELISEYYTIAPLIVKNIENSDESMQVYNMMWEDYLNPCYQLLLENKNAQSKALYIDLVRMLSKKYGIS